MHSEAIKAFGAFAYAILGFAWPIAVLVFCFIGGLQGWLGIVATCAVTSLSYIAASTNISPVTFKLGLLEWLFWFLSMLSIILLVYAMLTLSLKMATMASILVGVTLVYLRSTFKQIYHRVKKGPVISWFYF